ncbi:fungal-specific transcription factor domain-containing protein [Zychaea mexicana]|uniref:fungal-specific transcription factor domain-containing protein n=1 Tax=Zychaea mexicana TaxID=64656 RepID=UPI0022FF0F12|nr:fungal-specific transcription factor domain-containing protein [Zychaea mexicana]KAI9491078.1 fungal-specific transcription factor domain-containing protein [Zychaea mexicana]
MSSHNESSNNADDSKNSSQALKMPRQKRLKVNRACYTCRVKKIKCDGLQPCMQCRARQRPCSFSKDGPSGMEEDEYMGSSPSQTIPGSMDTVQPVTDSTAFDSPREHRQRKGMSQNASNGNREKHQGTLGLLDELSASWPAEGCERRWAIDEHLLYAKVPPVDSTSLDRTGNSGNNMVIQQHLITLFFRYRYATFPIIPKRTLCEHLERRGSLCTHLLLYAIYAHAALFADDDRSQANVYYSHAVALVDDHLDLPRLSTIVALCLLSLYEQPTDLSNNGYNATQSRSQAYSSIAFRMCFDLGLHKRYILNQRLNREDVELHKRIFWSCYCLDKMQNVCAGWPWGIQSKDIDLDLPLLQPGDDIGEHEVLEYFVTLIKLFQICEHAFQTDSVHSARAIVRSYEQEQLAYSFDSGLLMWLRSLPAHLQWTPFPTQANAVATQPPPNAMIAHLHLFYNLIELGVLRPYSAITGKTILHRCSTIATNITQLACSLAEQTNFILSYSFVSNALMAATRVHLLNCSSENLNFARHSRFMFQRSLRSLRTLYHLRTIPGVPEFTTTLKATMAAADTDTEIKKQQDQCQQQQQQEQEHQFEHPSSPTQSQQFVMNRATAAFSAHTLSAAAAHANASASLAVARQSKATLSMPSSHHGHNAQNVGNLTNQLSTNMMFDPNTATWRSQNQNAHQQAQPQPQPQQQGLNQHSQQQQHRVPYPLNLLSVDENWSKTTDASVDSILYNNSSNNNGNNNNASNSKEKSVFASFMDEHHKDPMKMNNDTATTTDIDELVAQMRFGKNDGQDDTTGVIGNKHTSWNNAAAAAAAAATVAAENDPLVYSMWSQQDEQSNSTRVSREPQQQEREPPTSPPSVASSTSHSHSTPYQSTYMNIGLGVYASAHQHHTDVIRQHFPGVESRANPFVRPVILTHQGHVIVAGSNQDTRSTPPPPQ